MQDDDFRRFYVECWKYCKPRLRHLIDDQADVDDVFAEAISKFWVYWQQGKIRHTDNLNALVYVSAKRLWFNQLRNKKPIYSMDDYDAERQFGEEAHGFFQELVEQEQSSQQQLLQKAWQRLDLKCQELLNVTIIYKERQNELFEKMGYKNADTVKATKYRCLQYLKKFYLEIRPK